MYYQGSLYPVAGGISSGAEGVGTVPRDYHRARAYFLKIARNVWPRDAPAHPLSGKKEASDQLIAGATAASAYLGRMYLRGEGVKQDARIAKMWFERGAEGGDRESNNGLGIIYRDGLVDNKKDLKKALTHFSIAAGAELAEAQVHIGKNYYSKEAIFHHSNLTPYRSWRAAACHGFLRECDQEWLAFRTLLLHCTNAQR